MWQQFNFFNWCFLAKTLTIHRTTEERNEPYLFPLTISTGSRTLSHLQFSIWNYYLLFSIATHVITRLLLDQSRDLNLKINVSSIFQVSVIRYIHRWELELDWILILLYMLILCQILFESFSAKQYRSRTHKTS